MAKIDKKYHKLLNKILDEGFKYEDPNRKGINRIQIPHYQFKHNFKDGFPAITTKKLYWKGIVGELLWFLRGETSPKYLIDNNINIWNKDAYNYYLQQCKKYNVKPVNDKEFIYHIKNKTGRSVWGNNNYKLGDLGRIYGAQWRDWTKNNDIVGGYRNSIDQISNLIKNLKEKPLSTNHIVTAWNPAELDDMALPPCHWSFEILVEPLNFIKRINYCQNNNIPLIEIDGDDGTESVLERLNIPKYQFTLKWHQRSVDTLLGLPFNIASYSLLAYIIGKITNMVPKGIIGDLSNVHIYNNHLDAVKEQLSRDVNKYDECKLDIYDDMGYLESSVQDIDAKLNNLKISDFKLEAYESYPSIKAEMLPYNN